MSKFTNWLEKQLTKRGWGYNEFGRRAGLSSGGVSLVMTERQKPGLEFCTKAAQALSEPPERVLRLAGLVPPLPGPENDDQLKDILEIAKRLIPAEREAVLEYTKWRLQKQEEQRRTGASRDSPKSEAAPTEQDMTSI